VISLSLAFLVFAGYTGYPILLRAILWIAKALLRKGPNHEALCLIFSNPRYFYFLLFPLRETLVLLGFWALITIVEFFMFFIEWNDILKPFSTSHKLLVDFFQTISVRICGFNNIDIGELTTGHLVTYIFTMYISAYPFIVTIRGTRQNAEKEPSVRKQTLKVLGRDLFWLYFGVLLLSLIEEERKSNSKVPNPFLRIVFEVVSAFGNVGLSTGFPHHSYSYSGSFFSFSKFIIIVVMLCGRHRGLPNSIDPAITPNERKTSGFEMDIELPTANPSTKGISSTPIEDVSETSAAASSSSSSSFGQSSKLPEQEEEGSQITRRHEQQEEEQGQQELEQV
jgi:Trk-type K+ transport system membrane component